LVVLRGEVPGSRVVEATTATLDAMADASFLIVAGTSQPSSDLFRATDRRPFGERR
jgi:hypothetical protein